MTPMEMLEAAKQMLLDPEFEPVIIDTLLNAVDVATAGALLVYPVILKMRMESDLDDDELLGNDEGDGIAIHLLDEIFQVAAEAGVEGADDPEMAMKAVEILGDKLSEAAGLTSQHVQGLRAQQGQPQPGAEQQQGQPPEQGLMMEG